jgi:hypothetical protein
LTPKLPQKTTFGVILNNENSFFGLKKSFGLIISSQFYRIGSRFARKTTTSSSLKRDGDREVDEFSVGRDGNGRRGLLIENLVVDEWNTICAERQKTLLVDHLANFCVEEKEKIG